MHTFVYVVDLTTQPGADIAELAEEARGWSRAHKGGLPAGFQTGSAALPVFLVTDVEHYRTWATSPQPLRWACPLFPIVVGDGGQPPAFRLTSQKAGILYESFFRDLAARLTAPAR
jgi:hypothetical protein